MRAWMGRMFFMALAGAIAFFVFHSPGTAVSQTSGLSRPGQMPAGDLQMVSSMLPTGVQQLVVLDQTGRTMAVYHIEPTLGKIQLKSVRSLQWDLKMEQFNPEAPTPSELRQVQP